MRYNEILEGFPSRQPEHGENGRRGKANQGINSVGIYKGASSVSLCC
jgi:hypothetical protein